MHEARFPFKRNRLRCVRCLRCVNENRKKRKRLLWQAANHGCHCFDRALLLVGACICCVKFSRNKRKRQPIGMLACVFCGFRLRNARNAIDCIWMEIGLDTVIMSQRGFMSWLWFTDDLYTLVPLLCSCHKVLVLSYLWRLLNCSCCCEYGLIGKFSSVHRAAVLDNAVDGHHHPSAIVKAVAYSHGLCFMLSAHVEQK